MKKFLPIAFLAMTALPVPGAAQGNPFQTFLRRYKPPAHVDVVKASLQPEILSGTLLLTVHDVITLMLENSLDVRVDRLSPLMSRYSVASTFGRFEPSFHLNAGMNHDISGANSQLDGAASLSRLGLDFSFGYSQVLRTGTSIGVEFRANRDSSNSVFNTFNPSYFSSLTYSVRQPFLGGAGRDTSMHPIRVAKIDQKISDVEFEMRLIDSITSAELRYWDLVLGQLDMKVQQRSLELAEKTLAANQHQVQAGTLAPIELVQAEAQVASRHEQILVASYGQDQLQDQMKRLITRTADPAWTLTRIEPVEAIHQPDSSDVLPVEQAIRYALESRPELRMMELELQKRDLDLREGRNHLLPVVEVFASYTQSGIGGTEAIRSGLGDDRILAVRNGGFLNSLGQMFGYNFTGYSAGINVTIPLSNKAARAEYSRAQTQKDVTETRRAALLQEIAIEVRNANSVIEMNRARIQAASKALEAAARQLAAEEKKNQIGISSIRFVFDEQRNLANAETNEIQARIDYTKALVQYDKAIGRTLRSNGIEIDHELHSADASVARRAAGN